MNDMTSAREQFGRTAQAYATSAVHARGGDLELLARIVEPGEVPSDVLIDVGTGAGHTLAALAGKFRLAVGLDPTPEMLHVARGVLRERGASARLVGGDVSLLPFKDQAAAAITCRVAGHHFVRPLEAFVEIARVLRRDGTFYLVDNYAPEDRTLDEFINGIERLRDPSHVREYTLVEWQQLLRDAGLRSEVRELSGLHLELDDWLARSQTPPAEAAEVRRRLRGAPIAAVVAFGITDTGFHLLRTIIVAKKA